MPRLSAREMMPRTYAAATPLLIRLYAAAEVYCLILMLPIRHAALPRCYAKILLMLLLIATLITPHIRVTPARLRRHFAILPPDLPLQDSDYSSDYSSSTHPP